MTRNWFVPIGYVRTEGPALGRARTTEDCLFCEYPISVSPDPSGWTNPSPSMEYCHNCSTTYVLALVPDSRMDCPDCGEFVHSHHNYCHYCGVELDDDGGTDDD